MPPPDATQPQPPARAIVRVRVFVDFWNFQLSIKRHIGIPNFPLDWNKLGPWLTTEAEKRVLAAGDVGGTRFEGMHVYLSYNPQRPADRGLKNWALNTLDRFPGVHVTAMERKHKGPPECPVCHKPIAVCPHCTGPMTGTIEKGVDTAMVTDMIRLAWEQSYDVAVLVSSDRDFIPAAEFLGSKGLKVVHAGFPPHGQDVARRCWASIDVKKATLPTRIIAAAAIPPASGSGS